ncbi:MAG: DUF2339 domain-containing protein, partial [Pseudomonadota bacterium]
MFLLTNIMFQLVFVVLVAIGALVGFSALTRLNALRRELDEFKANSLREMDGLRRRLDAYEVSPTQATPATPEGGPTERTEAGVEPLSTKEAEGFAGKVDAPVISEPRSLPIFSQDGSGRDGGRPAESVTDATTKLGPAPHSPPVQGGAEWWRELEEKAGKRWLTWAGVPVLFFGAAFFLKYAFDNEWIGPTGRVTMGIMAGIGMSFWGDRLVRKGMTALGQGLMGGGTAILYVSLFAAYSFYHLIPQPAAFGAMVIITAAGVALAVLNDAVGLSLLAVLGGFLTPVLLSTGQDARDALCAYITLLDLGVLAVGLFRNWRSLQLLAFTGTWLLFGAWFARYYSSPALVITLVWASVFFVTFLLVPLLYHFRRREPLSVESFVIETANALVGFGFAYVMLSREYSFTLGFLAAAMAACYTAFANLARRRLPDDGRSLLGFVVLAVT